VDVFHHLCNPFDLDTNLSPHNIPPSLCYFSLTLLENQDVEEIVWDIACLARIDPESFPPPNKMALPRGKTDRRRIMVCKTTFHFLTYVSIAVFWTHHNCWDSIVIVSSPMFTHYSGEMVQLNMICLKPGTMESESCFHYSVCSRCMTVEADFSSHYIFLEHLQSIFTQQLNYQHQWWILLSILPRTLLWNSKWSRQSGKVHEGCCFERLCEWTRGRGLHGFLC